MRVVPVGAGGTVQNIKLVDMRLAVIHENPRVVNLWRNGKPVQVQVCWLPKPVGQTEPNALPLPESNGWSRKLSVVGKSFNRPAGDSGRDRCCFEFKLQNSALRLSMASQVEVSPEHVVSSRVSGLNAGCLAHGQCKHRIVLRLCVDRLNEEGTMIADLYLLEDFADNAARAAC